MLNLKKVTNNFFVSKDIFKKYGINFFFKLLKIAPVNGHFLETVRATETYNHFLDTVEHDEKKVIHGKNAYR